MTSEWMKVMLEEIARKKADAEQVRAEAQRRSHEGSRGDHSPPPRPDTDRAQE
ncbi:MAG: hypothetical protein WA803_06510 [Steroidobacteraceae bacterium]